MAFPASAPAWFGVDGEPVLLSTQVQVTSPQLLVPFSSVHVEPEVWNPTVANLTLLVPWLTRGSGRPKMFRSRSAWLPVFG